MVKTGSRVHTADVESVIDGKENGERSEIAPSGLDRLSLGTSAASEAANFGLQRGEDGNQTEIQQTV